MTCGIPQVAARTLLQLCWGRWRHRASKDARLSTGYGAGRRCGLGLCREGRQQERPDGDKAQHPRGFTFILFSSFCSFERQRSPAGREPKRKRWRRRDSPPSANGVRIRIFDAGSAGRAKPKCGAARRTRPPRLDSRLSPSQQGACKTGRNPLGLAGHLLELCLGCRRTWQTATVIGGAAEIAAPLLPSGEGGAERRIRGLRSVILA